MVLRAKLGDRALAQRVVESGVYSGHRLEQLREVTGRHPLR